MALNRNPLFYCLLCLLLITAPSRLRAATSPLSKAIGKPADTVPAAAAAAEMTDEDIDANRLKLEARIAELHRQSTPQALAALHATYQEAATPQELEDRGKLMNKLEGILEDHSTALFRYRNYRKATNDKVEEMKAWKGFSEKPPYPLSLVDDLRDALDSKQSVLKSLDVIRATIEGEFFEFSSSLKNSSKQIRLAEENLETNIGKPGEQRSRWLLTLAQLRNTVNQAGVVYVETRRISVTELQKGAQAEADFLSQKLAVARGNYRFSEEELKQKLQSIDEQLHKVRQLLELSKGSEKETRRQLDVAETAVNNAQALLAAGGRLKSPLEMLLKEQKRRQVYFEDAGLRVLVNSGMSQLLKGEKILWEERYRINGGRVDQEIPAEIKNSRNELDLLSKWKSYVTNKLRVIEYNIKAQREALAAVDLTAGDREDARSFLALYQAQEILLQRGILFLNHYEQLVQRRDEEAKNKQVTLAGHASGLLAQAASLGNKLWYTELYVAEETIIVDNRKISRPRSVTVGKAVEAVMILIIGIWVIRRLKKFLHWIAISRLKLGANAAQLYTRLITYLLFIAVLVSALVFVNIPLAIFTFFGGALAIGIGFGAQTLINNFISGLILMFDRTIRMGDIVEVDGHRGRVASIGMRSSSIKRFDGVEMLVPNSIFLQQNVINWTSSDMTARYTVSVGVAYGSPTKKAEEVILAAVKEQREVLRAPPPYVIFESFADSALNFTAYFWIELDPEVNSLVVFSDIRHRIGERLAAAGIDIPFPQRDLHLSTSGPLEVKVTGPDSTGQNEQVL